MRFSLKFSVLLLSAYHQSCGNMRERALQTRGTSKFVAKWILNDFHLARAHLLKAVENCETAVFPLLIQRLLASRIFHSLLCVTIVCILYEHI